MTQAVRVEAPARLHLGLLDLRGDLGRWFGGLGVALQQPRVALEARIAPRLTVTGPQAERAATFARRFLKHHKLEQSAAIQVHNVIPPHVGLGSGTQLALSVARALAELFGIENDIQALARAEGRARRSAVGTWLFQRGGFVLEGGRRHREDGIGPLLFHHPVPDSWRCVLAIPDVSRGLSGKAEEAAFRQLGSPSTQKVGQIARFTLMAALPGLIEQDLEAFGRAITAIQRHVGDCFKPVQGGRFAHPRVARFVRDLERCGAHGVGQSSWGPTVFALAADERQADHLATVARELAKPGEAVYVTAFDNVGASSRSVRRNSSLSAKAARER